MNKKHKLTPTAALMLGFLGAMLLDILWRFLAGEDLVSCLTPLFVGLPMGILILVVLGKIAQKAWSMSSSDKEDKDV